MELNEEEMMKELPAFITDPNNQAKVEALIAGRNKDLFQQEQTRQIEANL